MIDEQRQRISALQDGELDTDSASRLVDALMRDRNLRGIWERYHLIGLAIRGERVEALTRSLADTVRARIEDEPTVLAPRRPTVARRVRLAPFAGGALAAAAVFIAVFILPTWFKGAATFQPEVGIAPQVVAQQPAAVLPAKRWDIDRPDLASKLDLFLVTHQETAPMAGAKGMLPYATFVGYEAGR